MTYFLQSPLVQMFDFINLPGERLVDATCDTLLRRWPAGPGPAISSLSGKILQGVSMFLSSSLHHPFEN